MSKESYAKYREYWTKEKVIDEAMKFKSYSEWVQKGSSSYYYADKNKWKDEINELLITAGKEGNTKQRWTKEEIIQDSKKYKKWGDLMANDPTLYKAILRYNLKDQIKPTMQSGKIQQWTKEKIIADAKKYSNLKEWRKNSPGAYRLAYKFGCYPECSKHFKRLTKLITKEDVFEEALKYNRRTEFQEYSPSYYTKALRNKWLDECCKHMMTLEESKEFGRPYRWTEKTIMEEVKKMKKWMDVYTNFPGMIEAITRLNLKEKIKSILKNGNEIKWTYEKLKIEALKYQTKKEFKNNEAGALRKIYLNGWDKELLSHMVKKQATLTEAQIESIIKNCKTKNELKTTNSKIYKLYLKNKNKYEHLFKKKERKIKKSLKVKKTKEQLIEEAKFYKTYTNWNKHCPNSTRLARKHGWMNEIKPFLNRTRKILTKQEVLNEALKYKRKIDFQKKSKSYYLKALREGWINECCKHMMSYKESAQAGTKCIWTQERIMQEVKKHNEISQLLKEHPGMRSALKRLNLFKIVYDMIPNKIKWDYNTLKNEALKYQTKKELAKNAPGAIVKIYKLGLAKELLSHMKTKTEQMRYWTDERILKAILECGSRNALKLKYPGAYFRTLSEKNKYKELFQTLIFNIELDVLHPQIIKILQKNNIRFVHHKKLKIKNKLVIPDFMFEFNSILYVIEAKSSGTFFNYCLKEISNQLKDQKKFVSHFNKNKRIKHILLSEEGLIKSKDCDYSMSLKELQYFLKNKQHKRFKSKYNHKDLSNKIRNNYIKNFF